MFLLGLLTFIVCMIIQFFAMNRIAFGRSMFITVSMFFVGSMIWLSPYPISQYLSWIFFASGWVFLLFMTLQSVRHFRLKKLTDHKS